MKPYFAGAPKVCMAIPCANSCNGNTPIVPIIPIKRINKKFWEYLEGWAKIGT